MKKKTFIVIWMLFIIFINSSMLIVSMVTLREQIFAEREKALAEHYVISSGLIGDMQAVKSRGGDVKASMDELMRTYSRYSQSRDNGFAVSCGKEWIWQFFCADRSGRAHGLYAEKTDGTDRCLRTFSCSFSGIRALVLLRAFRYTGVMAEDVKYDFYGQYGSNVSSRPFFS